MSSEAVRERCARAVRRWSVLVPFALPVVLLVLLAGREAAPLLLPLLVLAARIELRAAGALAACGLALVLLADRLGPLLLIDAAWFAPLVQVLALIACLGLAVYPSVPVIRRAGGDDEAGRERTRLGALLSSLDDLAFEFDADGRYLDVWTARPELLLMPREQLLQRNLHDVLGQAEGDRVLGILRAVLADGEPHEVEVRIRLADGRERHMLGRCARIAPSVATAAATVSCLVRDVTAQRQVEQALRDSEARLRTILETLPVGAVHHHVPSGTVTLNHAAERLLHYARAEVQRVEAWFARLYGEQAETVLALYLADRERGLDQVRTLDVHCGDGLTRRVQFAGCASGEHEVWVMTDVTAHERLQQRLQATQAAVDAAEDALYVMGEDGRFVDVNPAACRRLGWSREELLTMGVTDIDPLVGLEQLRAMREEVARKGHVRVESEHCTRDGERFPVEIVATGMPYGDGQYNCAIVRDISARRAAETQLRLYAEVFEHAAESIMITDAGCSIVAVNPAFTTVTGYAPDEVLGRNPRMLASGRQDAAFYRAFWQSLDAHGLWQGEIWNRRKSGEVFPEWLSVSVVRDADAGPQHYIAVFTDLSEHKAHERRIQFLAQYDPLTRLPNRVLLFERLEHALAAARRGARRCALLFLDLDRFKNVNDSLGHGIGDRLLEAVAQRLRAALRDCDTVARLGGDEFVVLLEDLPAGDGEREAALVAGKLLAALAQPFQIDTHELRITSSVGISLYPGHGADAETLIRSADTAMYHAKQSGRDNFQFFTEDMNARVLERLTLENGLRRALAQQGFALVWQPQLAIGDGRLIGFEALLRWPQPEGRAQVPPAQFIPVAEDCGLIGAIGDWVLDAACRQLCAWRAAGLPGVRIAVNLSALQLRDARLADKVAAALAVCGLDGAALELEVTESALMSDPPQTAGTLARLRALGVQLAIDDFGTGYSSLAYLKQFPIDRLKIDRSFVRDLASDPNDAAIARTIITLAHSLGLRVIAEGVETPAQLGFLRGHGCDEAQGYLYAPPLSPEQAAEVLAAGRIRPAAGTGTDAGPA